MTLQFLPQLQTPLGFGIYLKVGFYALITSYCIWSSLFSNLSTDADWDGVSAQYDPDDNDPCNPYPVYCRLNADFGPTDSLKLSLAGGNISAYDSLFLLTDYGGQIIDRQSSPRFGAQSPGLYMVFGLFFENGEEPSGTQIGNSIQEVSFPGSCAALTRGLTLKIVPTPSFPLEWISFEVHLDTNHHILLDWVTTAEYNCQDFTVERSVDGSHFSAIGSIKAQNIAQGFNSYQFADKDPRHETYYYRIRQLDLDGNLQYSRVREIHLEGQISPTLQISFNPSTDHLRLQLKHHKPQTYQLLLQDLQGKTVHLWPHKRLEAQALRLALPSIPSGVYLFRAEAIQNGQSFAKKLIIN